MKRGFEYGVQFSQPYNGGCCVRFRKEGVAGARPLLTRTLPKNAANEWSHWTRAGLSLSESVPGHPATIVLHPKSQCPVPQRGQQMQSRGCERV